MVLISAIKIGVACRRQVILELARWKYQQAANVNCIMAIVSLKSLCRGDYNISGKRCSLENTPTFLSVVQPEMRVSLRVIAQEMDIGTMACRERVLFCRRKPKSRINCTGYGVNVFGC